ncbi:MAG: hypothetical protein E6K82_13810 [Candidatus Rokuibacteriota bacterium]|nr:MAG: hypothetical protein E6K82_13810 [Candidatus Rokubacteria bacterium]
MSLSPPASPSANAAIDAMDRVAQATLAYFAGPGRTTGARVDRWQARDILMHFIYFHDATAWGIESASQGGPPWPVPADSDTVNEVCRRLREHESVEDLLAQLRQAHARLMRAARRAPDLDRPCFRRATGELLTGRQRLELLAKHWTEHVDELKAATV